MKWLDGIADSMVTCLSKLREIVKDRKAWHAAVHGLQSIGQDSVTEQQHKKTQTVLISYSSIIFLKTVQIFCLPKITILKLQMVLSI